MQLPAQSGRASAKMHPFNFTAVIPMRILTFFLLCGFSAATCAENVQPANLEPLPPPVFSSGPSADADEPEVTITEKKDQTVEEYRSGGRLYMIKIIPKVGPPYYLVDDQGDGKFSRQESLDSGVRPPRWIIKKF
jgi:hypothetical protein